MTERRVVITGLGALTPLGLDFESSWQGVVAGKSGVKRLHDYPDHPASTFRSQVIACVDGFDFTEVMTPKEARKVDIFVQYALVAASQALNDAGIEAQPEDAHRIGVAIGSGIGGIRSISDTYANMTNGGPRKVSPFFIPGAIINTASGIVSMKFGLRGPNIAIVTACTTGTHNIGYAARSIQYGDADVMVAGGTEMADHPITIAGFSACRALSTRNNEPEAASRPWDKDRDGFVLGNGAAVLILEEYEHAKKRGAKIYAELAGFGMSADAYHITLPEETGLGGFDAMSNAMNDAKLNPKDIDYINAHATSTPAGDVVEVRSIRRTFESHADKLAVSSTKSMTGHLLGAAGAVEAVFSILALRDQVAPPTINLDNPEAECDLNFVPHTAREMPLKVTLSNSFGFGGTNGTLIFKKI